MLFPCLSLFMIGCAAIKSIGKYPDEEQEAVFAGQPNYRDGGFRAPYPRLDTIDRDTVPRGIFRKERTGRFKKPKLSREMPHVIVNLRDTVFEQLTVVWFGHSSYLIQSGGFNILVDPVFSGYGSPVSFVNRSIDGSNVYRLDDLPPARLLLLTHDHYDHMDYKTVRQYRKSAGQVVAPLGMGRTLAYWGYKPEQFTELNWGDSLQIAGDICLIATPAQHFSGRYTKKNKTLYTSYVLKIHGYRLFLGGDGGYNKHFKDIGEQYGPFDLAILENGQYSPHWPHNHSFPEQTVQAAIDLHAKMILPVHWAKFYASYHPWNEPIERLLPVADSLGMPVTVPRIGEPYTLGQPPKREVWWDFE